jgi:hypothetical protein
MNIRNPHTIQAGRRGATVPAWAGLHTYEPGQKLKRVREGPNLRYARRRRPAPEIAERHGNDEFILVLSRMANIENKTLAGCESGCPASDRRKDLSVCHTTRPEDATELPAQIGFFRGERQSRHGLSYDDGSIQLRKGGQPKIMVAAQQVTRKVHTWRFSILRGAAGSRQCSATTA